MKKTQLNGNEFEYVVWNDNLSEMKHFCGDNCKITFETCCIDDYFMLKVDDYLRGKEKSVALHDYVIKLGENMFTVFDNKDFELFFKKNE